MRADEGRTLMEVFQAEAERAEAAACRPVAEWLRAVLTEAERSAAPDPVRDLLLSRVGGKLAATEVRAFLAWVDRRTGEARREALREQAERREQERVGAASGGEMQAETPFDVALAAYQRWGWVPEGEEVADPGLTGALGAVLAGQAASVERVIERLRLVGNGLDREERAAVWGRLATAIERLEQGEFWLTEVSRLAAEAEVSRDGD